MIALDPIKVAVPVIIFMLGLGMVALKYMLDSASERAAHFEAELVQEMGDHARTLSLLAETRQRVEEAEQAAAAAGRASAAVRAETETIRPTIRALPRRELTDAESNLFGAIDRAIGLLDRGASGGP